jgi:hypothetical protein
MYGNQPEAPSPAQRVRSGGIGLHLDAFAAFLGEALTAHD